MKKAIRLVFPGFWFGKTKTEDALRLAKEGVGGFCIYGGTPEEVKNLTQSLRQVAPHPLLIGADYETGLGRWHEGLPLLPTNYSLGLCNRSVLAIKKGFLTAVQAQQLGINWIFAPVVDLADTPQNPIVNTRSFNADPKIVVNLAKSFMIGLQDGGCLNSLKHFPGHGSSVVDSHLTMPIVDKDIEQLKQEDFAPFYQLLMRADSIMVGHLKIPALDKDLPASFSYKIMTALLRKTWHYKCLIITDALTMGAIKGLNPVDAFKAGADALLCPDEPFKLIEDLIKEVEKDPTLKTKVISSISIQEMLIAKLNTMAKMPCHNVLEACKKLNEDCANCLVQQNSCVNIIKQQKQITYLLLDKQKRTKENLPPFLQILQEAGIKLDHYTKTKKPKFLLVIYSNDYQAFSGQVNLTDEQKSLLQNAIKNSKDHIVISFGSPYINQDIEEIQNFVPLASKGEDFQKFVARQIIDLLNF